MSLHNLEFHTSVSKDSFFRRNTDRLRYSLRSYAPKRKTPAQSDVEAGSMLLKLGLCAAACFLVLLINSRQSASYYSTAQNDDADTPYEDSSDDLPGKLRFVEMPGLLSVFAAEEKIALPIECEEYSLHENDTLLCMKSKKQQSVFSVEPCKVEEIGKSDEAGSFVRLSSKDSEWLVAGLSQISVEKGQSLARHDTLGTIEEGETLSFKMRRAGKDANLRAYFSLKNEL